MTSVNSDLYLSPDQQDLLLAALNSNATSSSMFLPNSHSAHHPQVDDRQFIPTSDFGSLGHFTNQKSNPNGAHPVPTSVASNSDMDMTRTNSLTAFGGISTLHDSPVVGEMDFPFDMDGSYDYDTFPGDFETTIDSTNGTPAMYEHEKRKSPPTDDDGSPDAPETGPKRRGKETEDKVAKKPGRKPLTSEPTSKRKAQNRAAQRAFRERKEKHLKDLEEKVEALEKSSENANKENSLLRAQIERLQTELHEYRKRMNESKTNFSNVLGKGSNGGFQFEFPMFGGVNKPTSSRLQAEKNNEVKRAPSNGSASGIKTGPGTLLERPTPTHGSSTNSTPNARLLNGTPNAINPSRASNSPPSTQRSVSTVYSGLFTPSTVGTARDTPAEFTMKRANEITISNDRYTPGQGKHDPSSSPSASSVSHHGTSSSYMTSPESSSYSPAVYKSQDNLESVSEEIQEIQVVSSDHDEPDFYCGVLDDGETSFCEKLGAIACGNPRNPMPLPPDSKLLPNLNEIIPRPDPASVADRRNSIAANSTPFAFDAGFDQVPFKEYRDPMDPSNADMDMSFFNDAFPMADFALGSPIIPASPAPEVVDNVTTDPKKQAVFGLEDPDEADYSSEDEALMITGKADSGLMSCNKIWDRISVHPKFVSGELDMDNLCSELRAKAKCSETGVVVGERDVEEVLSKVGLKLREVSQQPN